MIKNSIGEKISIGDKVWCFDPDLYVNDFLTPPSVTVRLGIVVNIYQYKDRKVADIDFEHKDKISKAHFVSGLRLYG